VYFLDKKAFLVVNLGYREVHFGFLF